MARCIDCGWFDDETGECIKFKRRVRFPFIVRLCPYYNRFPPMAERYLEQIAKTVESSKSEVMRSRPFKNFLRTLV